MTVLVRPEMVKNTTSDGMCRLSGIVSWPHRRGGQAHCLARVFIPRAGERRPTAVVSEIRSNPDGIGIIDDFPAVADAVLAAVGRTATIAPAAITWLAHHGAFSYADIPGPETFTEVTLTWDGEHYQGDFTGHRLLTRPDHGAITANLALEPVASVLADLAPDR
jgi:hypothetical protein